MLAEFWEVGANLVNGFGGAGDLGVDTGGTGVAETGMVQRRVMAWIGVEEQLSLIHISEPTRPY